MEVAATFIQSTIPWKHCASMMLSNVDLHSGATIVLGVLRGAKSIRGSIWESFDIVACRIKRTLNMLKAFHESRLWYNVSIAMVFG